MLFSDVPLYLIHLIAYQASDEAASVMYCGAKHAIAAIHSNRVPTYTWEYLCPSCLAITLGRQQQSTATA